MLPFSGGLRAHGCAVRDSISALGTARPVTGAAAPARISATVASMGHGTGVITAAVYFGTPWSNTWKHVIDAVLYGLATGAIFAAMWP